MIQKKNASKKTSKLPAKNAPTKPMRKKNATFEDLKNELQEWIKEERVPGKFQAWFTEAPTAHFSDWKIISQRKGEREFLVLEAPSKEVEVPEVVLKIREQLDKEHLRIFKKALRQIWFRALGTGEYAMVVQANFHGKNSLHGCKTLQKFVANFCPEIISFHVISCQPNEIFNPSFKQNIKVTCKKIFGDYGDFIPLKNTGFKTHVLDWTPLVKDAWLSLPTRIKEAIHPNKEDKFFEFFSGSSFVSASLAEYFSEVHAMDAREFAMSSSKLNAQNLLSNNFRFHRSLVSAEFFQKFFAKKENEGRWTFYFNVPEIEGLAPKVIEAAAASRPERILLQMSSLVSALKEMRRLRNAGYVLRKTIPLYLEPGSSKFELLMLFVPDRNGLLGANALAKKSSMPIKRPRESVKREKSSNSYTFEVETPIFKQRKG